MTRLLAALFLLLQFSVPVFATSLEEAIYNIYLETPPEITKEDYSYNSSVAQSAQSAGDYIPKASLYYTLVKPGTPAFDGPINTDGSFPIQFITGLTQEQYGISLEYNLLAISQLMKKVSAISSAKNFASSQANSAKSNYVYSLVQAYIDYYRANETVTLQEKILETASKRKAELKTLFQYGKTPKSDMLVAESDFLKSRMNLKNAKNLLNNSAKKYEDIFYSPPPQTLELPKVSLADIAPNLQTLKEKIHQNYDFSAIKSSAKGLKIESQIAKLSLLPKVTVAYRHNFTNPDQNLNIPNYNQGIASINASVDLLNVRNFFASRQFIADFHKKNAEAEILLKKYVTEAEELWHEVKYLEEMEIVMEEVLQSTHEVYKITQNEVLYGTKTFADELLARQHYFVAKLDLLDAKLQKTLKLYRLKFLTSQILPNNK